MDKQSDEKAEDTFVPGRYGWQGDLGGFIDRMMLNEDCVPYVVVRCSCGGFLSDLCTCSDIMVTPIFNATKGWLDTWHQHH
jgi:hypothetical protein